MKNKKINFIVFSSINWSTHHQLHHELTNSILNNGHNVLFVENTGIRSIKFNDLRPSC